ncbi:MAG: hypothetical protein MUC87_08405, partial [Bacteroidia bacterium]|nr:hypothetical protein [Bacteroidia bacterium]
ASVALQMVGISYQNIRKHLVKIIPEPVVEGMEKGFEIVKALITEGPMAAWEQLQEMAGEMKEAFVDAVKNWIKETIIVKAIEFIASLIIPGAGIIKAIIGIYDTIVFFIQKAKDIAQMVGNFLGSIGEIAMGNIGAAANALENGLATALTLVISFLAKLIHLDGVTAKIRAALNKIRGKVENMMAKVAKWIADKAKKLWGGVKKTAGDIKDKLFSWAFAKKTFTASDGKNHSLNVEEVGGKPKLIMRSDPHPVIEFLNAYANTYGGRSKIPQNIQGDFNTAYSMVDANGSITKKIAAIDKAEAPNSTFSEAQKTALRRDLLGLNTDLSKFLEKIVGTQSSLAKARERYKLEGTTGKYNGMIRKLVGDELTPDHQPQGSILSLIKADPYSAVFTHLPGIAAKFYDNGYAIMLYKDRHSKGRTYGRSVSVFNSQYESGFNSQSTEKKKREYFITALENERNADADAMAAVYNTPESSDAVWGDLKRFTTTAAEKTLLVSEIRKNVLDGLRTIKAQNFLHLKASTD